MQKKKITKKRKYVGGGMYEENTIPLGKGSTAATVYQESNPALQAQRQEAYAAQTAKSIQDSSDMAEEIKANKAGDAAATNEAKMQSDNRFDSFSGYAQQLADAGKGTEEVVGGGKTPIRSAINTFKEARHAKQTMKSVEAFNSGKAFMDSQAIARDGMQSFQTAKDLKLAKSAFKAASPVGKTLTMDGLQTASQIKDAGAFGSATLGKGAELSTSIGSGGNMAASQGTQALAQGSAIGKGLGSFAKSGAGIGTIASLAGMGVSKFSDDGDATKSNVGEYSGSTLSGVGTGIGAAMGTAALLGSTLGPVGTAIGAGVGALYGAGKQFFGTRKAQKEQAQRDNNRRVKVTKFNKETTAAVANQAGIARMGELRQKNYTGYNSGRNTTAKLGGYRSTPKYV
jgi:hypothetical protein